MTNQPKPLPNVGDRAIGFGFFAGIVTSLRAGADGALVRIWRIHEPARWFKAADVDTIGPAQIEMFDAAEPVADALAEALEPAPFTRARVER